MCGFAGIYHFDGEPVDARALANMRDVQRHRGPDDRGLHLFSLQGSPSFDASETNLDSLGDGPWEGGLGFNRLSILDLSQEGRQPMRSADGSLLIAYNGEVYNAFEHRDRLQQEGFVFRSRTDTEVLLGLYQRHGFEGMLERLNGMFAFALVDFRDRRLYLARDRLGIKPLYWWRGGDVLLFASEIKSFLEHPAFKPELDHDRLDEHFLFRYCAGSDGLLKGVKQLEPGHWLSVQNGRLDIRRYWTLPTPSGDRPANIEQAAHTLQSHLERSVRMQLLSDVKVGCQLSGGIDSSLVTLFAAKQSPGSLEGFSIVFDDRRVSEEPWIDEAARVAGVRAHKHRLTSQEFYECLDAATWHLDQPINHPNSLGIYRLAEQARRRITVFLSGEGADELLGGYTRFFYAKLRSEMRLATKLACRMPFVGPKLQARLAGPDDLSEWFILQSAFLTPERVLELRPEANPAEAVARRRAIMDQTQGDCLTKCLRYEMRTYLVDLLIRQDKMTMAHSMENRVPYLDHELVEYVCSLPHQHLIGGRVIARRPRMEGAKILLKKVAGRYFRPGFTYRLKSGFPLPLHEFYLDRPFRELMEDRLLPGMRSRGVIDASVVDRWWRRTLQGERRELEGFWICIAFELWAQQFLDAGTRNGNRHSMSQLKAIA